MKTKLASVLGLAVFAASFICGGSLVYAETEETSSVMQIIGPVTNANGVESELSCSRRVGRDPRRSARG